MLLMTESQDKKIDRDEAITLPKLFVENTLPAALFMAFVYSLGSATIEGHKCEFNTSFHFLSFYFHDHVF